MKAIIKKGVKNKSSLWSNPLFGLSLYIFAYLLAMLIFRRFPNPITTPLLLATVFIIIFLKLTGISYKSYYVGGSYLNQLIVPSTVALGIPLHRTFYLMKHYARSILCGIFYQFLLIQALQLLLQRFLV